MNQESGSRMPERENAQEQREQQEQSEESIEAVIEEAEEETSALARTIRDRFLALQTQNQTLEERRIEQAILDRAAALEGEERRQFEDLVLHNEARAEVQGYAERFEAIRAWSATPDTSPAPQNSQEIKQRLAKSSSRKVQIQSLLSELKKPGFRSLRTEQNITILEQALSRAEQETKQWIEATVNDLEHDVEAKISALHQEKGPLSAIIETIQSSKAAKVYEKLGEMNAMAGLEAVAEKLPWLKADLQKMGAIGKTVLKQLSVRNVIGLMIGGGVSEVAGVAFAVPGTIKEARTIIREVGFGSQETPEPNKVDLNTPTALKRMEKMLFEGMQGGKTAEEIRKDPEYTALRDQLIEHATKVSRVLRYAEGKVDTQLKELQEDANKKRVIEVAQNVVVGSAMAVAGDAVQAAAAYYLERKQGTA